MQELSGPVQSARGPTTALDFLIISTRSIRTTIAINIYIYISQGDNAISPILRNWKQAFIF